MNNVSFAQNANGQLIRNRGINEQFDPKGLFQVEHFDINQNRIGSYLFPNGIVTEGKNHILDVSFRAAAQTATWYIGIIDSSGYSALNAADTMASHAGWNEFTTYTEATRVEWVEGAPSAGSISNSSPSVFNVTGSGTLKGVFVTSVNTKAGTSGILWATALFSADIVVSNGDQLKITYTVSA